MFWLHNFVEQALPISDVNFTIPLCNSPTPATRNSNNSFSQWYLMTISHHLISFQMQEKCDNQSVPGLNYTSGTWKLPIEESPSFRVLTRTASRCPDEIPNLFCGQSWTFSSWIGLFVGRDPNWTVCRMKQPAINYIFPVSPDEYKNGPVVPVWSPSMLPHDACLGHDLFSTEL